MVEDNKKIKNLTIIVFGLIIAIISGTYAYFEFDASTSGIAGESNCYTVNYVKGQEISGEIEPVASYTQGKSTDVVMYSDANCSPMSGTLYITTNNDSTMDFSDEALRYTVVVNNQVVSEGAVNGTANQVIYEGFMLNTSSTTYQVYVWLDVAKEDFINLDDESFSGFIHAKAVATSDIASNYIINPNCTNATATFDYAKRSILLSNVSSTGTINCSLTSTTVFRTPLSEKIISLLGNSTSVASEAKAGNGSTLEIINSPLPTSGTSTDYRYRGIDPANYVMFNDELWRIIGVFDSNSHGIPNTNLVKIIRNDSIGVYVWDNSGDYGYNNYPTSDIYNLLNKAYYNTTSVTAPPIDATGQDYCYADSTSLPGKCNFTKIGIQPEYKKMVEDSVTWYLGGNGSTLAKASAFYTAERTSTSKYTDNVATTTTTTPIGLMYASDYGYAAPAVCDDINIGVFFTSSITINNVATTCVARDWLKSNYYEWTITHSPSNSYRVFYLDYSGNLSNTYARNGSATRPVLYLDSSVYYLSGTGTQTDPYIIAMD